MHPQQSPPQLPDSGSAGMSSKRLQIVQYSDSLLFFIIPLPKRPVLADCCLSPPTAIDPKQPLGTVDKFGVSRPSFSDVR
jgi:hypothetical protein